MNDIAKLQNEEQFLKLLRARSQVYVVAKRWMTLQLFLALALPLVGALLLLFWPSLRATVAALSLLAGFVDVTIVDRQYRQSLKKAAKIAEEFDCRLLRLPWDQFTVGERIDKEDIHAAATAYRKHTNDEYLVDWYPKSVERAPLPVARLICQRTNLRYDGKLRRIYGIVLLGLVAALLLVLFGIGLALNVQLQDWVLTLAPASPILTWGAREFYRQKDTADSLLELKKEIEKLWAQAGDSSLDEQLLAEKARLFQSGLYLRRANSPLTLPFLYDLLRTKLEAEMNAGADDLLGEYEAKVKVPRLNGKA